MRKYTQHGLPKKLNKSALHGLPKEDSRVSNNWTNLHSSVIITKIIIWKSLLMKYKVSIIKTPVTYNNRVHLPRPRSRRLRCRFWRHLRRSRHRIGAGRNDKRLVLKQVLRWLHGSVTCLSGKPDVRLADIWRISVIRISVLVLWRKVVEWKAKKPYLGFASCLLSYYMTDLPTNRPTNQQKDMRVIHQWETKKLRNRQEDASRPNWHHFLSVCEG